jgi:type III secretion protein S
VDFDNIVNLTSHAMILCLLVSLPVVLVSAVVGLLVSFVQAITSLQDQAISQGAKLIAVVITLLISAPWGASLVLGFARQALAAALQ